MLAERRIERTGLRRFPPFDRRARDRDLREDREAAHIELTAADIPRIGREDEMRAEGSRVHVCRVWTPEDHAYTRLARAGRDQLPAGLLLPGDAVEVEGFVLIIENVICSARSVALHFIEPSDWMLCLGRDKRVRVISKVERFTPTGRGRLTLDDVLDPR